MDGAYASGALFLALAAWADWRTRRIPLPLTVSGLVASLAARAVAGGWSAAAEGLAAGALLGSLALVPALATRGRGWGGGDVLAFLVIGAAFGTARGLHVVEAGLVAGAVLSAGALALRRISRSTPLPLVSFLFLGCLIAGPP